MQVNKIMKLTELYGKEAPSKQLAAANLAKQNHHYDQAIKWYEKLVTDDKFLSVKGEAAFELAEILDKVKGYKNPNLATSYYEISASEGNGRAMYVIGCYCIDGDGLYIKNEEVGKKWLEFACKAGNIDAYNKLGVYYVDSTEVDLGISFLKKAAEYGNSLAMRNLGKVYERKNDREKAIKWYNDAIDNGDKESKSILDRLVKTNRIK